MHINQCTGAQFYVHPLQEPYSCLLFRTDKMTGIYTGLLTGKISALNITCSIFKKNRIFSSQAMHIEYKIKFHQLCP